jgi:predicted TIM-barrel enzyme
MRRIRILLAGMPRMLLDMMTDIIVVHGEMTISGKMEETADIGAAVKKAKADVIIVNESGTGQWQNYRELLYSCPHLRVLSITNDGHHFFLHKLHPVCTALGEISPEKPVQAVRSSEDCGLS